MWSGEKRACCLFQAKQQKGQMSCELFADEATAVSFYKGLAEKYATGEMGRDAVEAAKRKELDRQKQILSKAAAELPGSDSAAAEAGAARRLKGKQNPTVSTAPLQAPEQAPTGPAKVEPKVAPSVKVEPKGHKRRVSTAVREVAAKKPRASAPSQTETTPEVTPESSLEAKLASLPGPADGGFPLELYRECMAEMAPPSGLGFLATAFM